MDVQEKITAKYYENLSKIHYDAWKIAKATGTKVDPNLPNGEKTFKQDCIKELGIKDHPKAERFFEICWAEGHAYGY